MHAVLQKKLPANSSNQIPISTLLFVTAILCVTSCVCVLHGVQPHLVRERTWISHWNGQKLPTPCCLSTIKSYAQILNLNCLKRRRREIRIRTKIRIRMRVSYGWAVSLLISHRAGASVRPHISSSPPPTFLFTFIHSFVHSFVHSLLPSFIFTFLTTFIHLFIYNSFNHSSPSPPTPPSSTPLYTRNYLQYSLLLISSSILTPYHSYFCRYRSTDSVQHGASHGWAAWLLC